VLLPPTINSEEPASEGRYSEADGGLVTNDGDEERDVYVYGGVADNGALIQPDLSAIIANERNPRWLTPTVVSLARSIYADGQLDCLPILADVLQDAGCEDPDILTHCRSDGPHVRGCWVVDLVLGKG
jgi:hypothetical protein